MEKRRHLEQFAMRLANRPDHYQLRIRHTPADQCVVLIGYRSFHVHDQEWATVPTFGCGLLHGVIFIRGLTG
jgi:hypothetical protein